MFTTGLYETAKEIRNDINAHFKDIVSFSEIEIDDYKTRRVTFVIGLYGSTSLYAIDSLVRFISNEVSTITISDISILSFSIAITVTL